MRVDEINREIHQLVDDMVETMRAANGLGLAAPQVGRRIMMFVVDGRHIEENGSGIKVFINPEIIEYGSSKEAIEEGCLSLPQVFADVLRPNRIRVRYQTLDGALHEEELQGLPARVFQHEFDHLIGVLLIDRVPTDIRHKLKGALQAILDGSVKAFDPNDTDPHPSHKAAIESGTGAA